MTDAFLQRFAGIGRLYGRGGLARLAAAHVAVVGLGGVGSWAVEALARSGVGALTLVDMDDVCISNSNRQLQALASAYGRAKPDVLRARVLDINPECRVAAVQRFFTKNSAAGILTPPAGFPALTAVADAIDSLGDKCLLIAECRARGVAIACSGGCAGKRDGTAVRIGDISRSEADNLLRFVRKKLRLEYKFPGGGKRREEFGVPCVWSPELSAGAPSCGTPGRDASDALPGDIASGDALRPNCEWGYGTVAHVCGAFGLALAGIIISKIAAAEWPLKIENRPADVSGNHA
jgi:tRNA A37 threonylcarbamoyladenosine dehydratase